MDCGTLSTASEIWDVFENHFTSIAEELATPLPCSDGVDDSSISWSYRRIKELVNHNARDGKRMRGLTVVSSYVTITEKDGMNDEDLKIALTLGWAIEILQASFLVADDIMDQSQTRRGKPCWYRVEGIGLQAVNDSMLLESCVFKLIKNHCRHKPYYTDLSDLFREVTMLTELGQSLDMETSEKPEVDFSVFTHERYHSIIKYKTAFYSFYLPVAVALYVTGNADDATLKISKEILTEIGCYFQVQDDFLDAFGDPSITGKIGTDIESNKCSWLIVKALEKCTKEQREILQNNYGRRTDSNKDVVIDIYKKIDLQGIYHSYEEDTYRQLKNTIETFEHPTVPNKIFLNLLNKIYRRNK